MLAVAGGLLRRAILLPAQAEEWPAERRRVALLHELAHLQRRDLLTHLLAQLACACYWMHPLVWLAAYRMRIERETACDDAVLNSDVIEQTLVISSFFTFAEPGRYTVRVKQFAPFYPLDDHMHFQGTADAEVTVLPFDAQRLKARIDQHWSEMRDKGHVDFHPKVLYSVRHNLALPALEWMMREWGDDYAARAIIRIGTPEARQLLKHLQSEPGRIGKGARAAEKMSLAITMWDIANGTARKITPQNTATQPAGPRQPVAGAPYHGLLVSLGCDQSYRAGQPVLFKVIEKNTGEQTLRYAFYRFPYYYHLYLTDAQGKPVEKPAETIAAEYEEDHITVINRPQSVATLKPGEEKVRTYDLRQYFKSIPAGSYTLQVRRTARDFMGFTPGEGDRGALSLPCRFTIKG